MESKLSYAVIYLASKLTCIQVIYCRFVTPLRRIPGPFLASLSEYWLILVDLPGLRTTVIHKLHEKYGPVVRIGPNEVSFSDVSIVKEIYGQQSAYMKAPWYDSVSLHPVGIFSMRNKADHSKGRSLLSHAFSQASLNNTIPTICATVKRLSNVIAESGGHSVDAMAKFRRFALDVVGELFLGASFGALEASEPPQFLADTDLFFLTMAIEEQFPWIYRVLSITPISKLQYALAARQRVAEVC